jgi:PAS domain S-box-containing protein
VTPLHQRLSSDARTSAARVAGAYGVVGVLWILFSDRLLDLFVFDPIQHSQLQTVKGWLFVAASAAFIWWRVRQETLRLQRTESHLEALAGQDIVGTFVLQDGRIVHANRRLADIFGTTVDALMGRRVLELVVDEDQHRVRESLGESPNAGSVVAHHSFRGIGRDGATLDAEVHARTVDWNGQPAMAGILLDVSDRALMEDRLRRAGRLEALGEVTGAVAHDFNNFLQGILGNLDLVLDDLAFDTSSDTQESLQTVRDTAARAATLTGQLLAFSRGKSHQHRPMDPNVHLTKLGAFLRTLCEGGQTLVLDLDPDLPNIILDPSALDQVALNLFVNAKQAVRYDGTITLRTRQADGDVIIEVQDDGVGMPPDVRAHIFEPYFTTKEAGTGLGLATVRSIVDECRGHLSVESEAGRGTTMRVHFPATSTRCADTVPSARPTAAAHGPPRRVLIVDPDPAVSRLVATALQRHGHQAVAAQTAMAARSIISSPDHRVDLVICDDDLPDDPANGLLEEIRRHQAGVRILLMSTDRPRNSVPGSHRELLKPFSMLDLVEAVNATLAEGGPGSKSTRA